MALCVYVREFAYQHFSCKPPAQLFFTDGFPVKTGISMEKLEDYVKEKRKCNNEKPINSRDLAGDFGRSGHF